MTALRKTLIAAALGTALATPALAAPVEQLTNGDFFEGIGGWGATAAVSPFAGAAQFGAMFGQLTQTFTSSATGPYTISFDYSTAGGWLWATFYQENTFLGETGLLQGSNQSWSVSVPESLVAGLQYTVNISGAWATVDNVSVKVSAVPGPIAGAGLPIVLGMMGFAAWRRRQAA